MTISSEILGPLVVDHWKLILAFQRCLPDLPASKGEKAAAQLRYSQHRLSQILEQAEIRLGIFDGQPFSAELPVTAVNAEDLVGEENLAVARTLEPAIIYNGSVIHTGKVLLKGAS